MSLTGNRKAQFMFDTNNSCGDSRNSRAVCGAIHSLQQISLFK